MHASKTQLGGMMHQDHGAIAYHSRRLTKYQEIYSTSIKEALSVVSIPKPCSTALLCNEIHANADALNSLGKNKLSSRLSLLLSQDHDVHINHIDGTSNLFSDAL